MENIGIQRDLQMSYEDALAKLPDALKSEGFGVLTEIDVKETLKKKIDVDVDDFPADPDLNYGIPPDNPFVGVTGDDETDPGRNPGVIRVTDSDGSGINAGYYVVLYAIMGTIIGAWH